MCAFSFRELTETEPRYAYILTSARDYSVRTRLPCCTAWQTCNLCYAVVRVSQLERETLKTGVSCRDAHMCGVSPHPTSSIGLEGGKHADGDDVFTAARFGQMSVTEATE